MRMSIAQLHGRILPLMMLLIMTGASAPAQDANLRVIHGVYDAPPVDILVNDAAAIRDLAYGGSSGFATLPSGQANIKVVPTGETTPVVLQADLPLIGGSELTLFALPPLADNGQIDVVPVFDDRIPDPDNARLRFVHLGFGAPAVDIKVDDPAAAPLIANIGFSQASNYQLVPEGTFSFVVTVAGDDNAVFSFAPIDLAKATVYTVVAHGTLADDDEYPFGVRVFIDNGDGDQFVDLESVSSEAHIRVIHGSYDAPPVDVLVDDNVALENLAYGASSGYATLPASEYNVKVVPTGETTPVVFEADLPLAADTDYTVFAVPPLMDDGKIGAVPVVDLRDADPDNVRIRFVHLAPDAPNVDIKVADPASAAVFADVAFQSVTEYQTIPAGSYAFVVTAAGGDEAVIAFDPVEVANASVYTVLAHGTLAADDEYPFAVRVFVDNGDGDQFVDLTAAATESRLRVIHTGYDAPPVDVLLDDDAAVTDLAYGASSGYATLPAAEYNVKLVPTGETAPIVFEDRLALAPDTDYSVFAVAPLADDDRIDLVAVADAREADPDNVRIRFAHLAPDAPNVDIKVADPASAAVFADVAFQSVTEYQTIPAGSYAFVVTAAGGDQAVISFAPVEVANESVYTVVAHGTLAADDEYPFAVRVFVDNGEGTGFADLEPALTSSVAPSLAVSGNLRIQTQPSPAAEHTILRYQVGNDGAGRLGLEMYDNNMRLVSMLDLGLHQPGSFERSLDLSRLADGRYWLLLRSEKEAVVLPLTILR